MCTSVLRFLLLHWSIFLHDKYTPGSPLNHPCVLQVNLTNNGIVSAHINSCDWAGWYPEKTLWRCWKQITFLFMIVLTRKMKPRPTLDNLCLKYVLKSLVSTYVHSVPSGVTDLDSLIVEKYTPSLLNFIYQGKNHSTEYVIAVRTQPNCRQWGLPINEKILAAR